LKCENELEEGGGKGEMEGVRGEGEREVERRGWGPERVFCSFLKRGGKKDGKKGERGLGWGGVGRWDGKRDSAGKGNERQWKGNGGRERKSFYLFCEEE
jgi:hypothetical protein